MYSCQNSDNSIKSYKTPDSATTYEPPKLVNQLDSLLPINNFTLFKCLSNCAGNCNTDLKSNGELPFKINKSVIGDTLKVVFHFVSDGCQKFDKVTKFTNDTIYLDYKSISNSICECYSEYKYEYAVTNFIGKTIILKNKKI